MVNQLFFRSAIDPECVILTDDRVIQSCSMIKDVASKLFKYIYI